MARDNRFPQPLMTSEDVMQRLNIKTIRTLDQWAYRHAGPPFIKVGKHRRYPPDGVERWLDQQRRGGDAA